MKRLIVIVSLILLSTGCINMNNASYSEIINEVIKYPNKVHNSYRNGYKFYLPLGLYVEETKEYNEEIKGNGILYYLYVDIISYLKKADVNYQINSNAIYSSDIIYKNKKGYIEINKYDDKYMVEIMYNYAKIEVIVEESELREAITNAIIILASVKYKTNVLDNLTKENLLSYNEEAVDIFSAKGKENSNFLKILEDYSEEETTIPDYDLIK